MLAFTAHNDNGKHYRPVGGRAVFLINLDGTRLRRLTPWSLNAGGDGLDWSPDGAHILFRTVTFQADDPGPSYGDVYTIALDGTQLRRLTHFPADTAVQLGSYSPDGTRIVFSTSRGAATHPTGQTFPDVFAMNANGTDIHPVTRTKNWEGEPRWR